MEQFNLKEFFSVFLILFSIIDILGSLPVIITMKKRGKQIKSAQASLVAGVIMLVFMYLGEEMLKLFGVDIQSFAIAGAIVLLLIGLEMILGITLFKDEEESGNDNTVVPIAFPLIAGAGTLTTILTVKSEYANINIIFAILLNIIVVFFVLRSSSYISRKLGSGGMNVLRKVFGIILLAIAIKIFSNYIPALVP